MNTVRIIEDPSRTWSDLSNSNENLDSRSVLVLGFDSLLVNDASVYFLLKVGYRHAGRVAG